MTDIVDELRWVINNMMNQAKDRVAEIERLRGFIAEWKSLAREHAAEVERLRTELAECRTKIAAMERQEPVAWMCPDDPERETAFSWHAGHCKSAGCDKWRVPLYLAPGAKENNDE